MHLKKENGRRLVAELSYSEINVPCLASTCKDGLSFVRISVEIDRKIHVIVRCNYFQEQILNN